MPDVAAQRSNQVCFLEFLEAYRALWLGVELLRIERPFGKALDYSFAHHSGLSLVLENLAQFFHHARQADNKQNESQAKGTGRSQRDQQHEVIV